MKRCRKIRHRDRLAALIALANAERKGKHPSSTKREEARAYRCPDCGGWHLTSRP